MVSPTNSSTRPSNLIASTQVIDLARHFDDGRLSASKLATWSEVEVQAGLIDVHGIGNVRFYILLVIPK